MIFVHIPKCAGSTVSLGMFGYRIGHSKIDKYWKIDKEFTLNAFKFTFVRHPYLRLYSAFSYLKKGGMSVRDQKLVENLSLNKIGFEEFIDLVYKSDDYLNIQHLAPQYFYCSVPGNAPYKIHMDFIGKTEFFSRDMEFLMDLLPDSFVSLKPILLGTRVNVSNKSSRGSLPISDESLSKVREIYDFDFELFGYDEWGTVESITELYSKT
jgi:hypothetical protein